MSLRAARRVSAFLFLLAACGSPTPSSVGAGPIPEDVPKRATITCARAGTTTSTHLVQPLPDGAHISIENRGDFKEYSVRAAGANGGHGGRLGDGVNAVVTPLQPGELWIGCYDRPEDYGYGPERSPAEVVLKVVDSDHLYQRHDLECGEAKPESGGHFEHQHGYDPHNIEGFIRTSIPGVRSTDTILYPGYPKVEWKGDFRVIQREDRRVALVLLWGIDVERCPGVDIGDG